MSTIGGNGFEDGAALGAAGSVVAAALALEYTVVGTGHAIVDGRKSGTLAWQAATGSYYTDIFGGTRTTVFLSGGLKLASYAASAAAGRSSFQFMEGSICHVSLTLLETGIAVYRGDGSTLLGAATHTPGVSLWDWLQVKTTIHDSTGSVEIRDAAGTVLLALSGIDTKNGGTGFIDRIRVGNTSASSAVFAFDDYHVWDDTGSICNTWTNDTMILRRYPTGAGNYAQHTPSAGSNWQCVDDAAWA